MLLVRSGFGYGASCASLVLLISIWSLAAKPLERSLR
jgi:hypothetical protein